MGNVKKVRRRDNFCPAIVTSRMCTWALHLSAAAKSTKNEGWNCRRDRLKSSCLLAWVTRTRYEPSTCLSAKDIFCLVFNNPSEAGSLIACRKSSL